MACSFERGPVTACWQTSAAIPGWPTSSPACRTSSISEVSGKPRPSLSARPEQRRPDHGPVLQQGAARPGGSRAAEDHRRPQGDGRSHWRHSASHRWSTARGEVSFNPLLVMWLLPMIAERAGDPVAFVESTIKGEVGYDSPEWIEAFQTIDDLRTSGVLLAGSGATDYATMQQLLLQGKAAMTYNGTWLLPPLQAGTPTVPFDLHVAPLPLVDGASKARSLVSWAGFALPANGCRESRGRLRVPRIREPARRSTRRSPRDSSRSRRSLRRMSRSTTRSNVSSCRCSTMRSCPSTGFGSRRSMPRSATRSRRSSRATPTRRRREGSPGRRRATSFVRPQLLPMRA